MSAPPVPEGLVRFELAHGGVCFTDGVTLYLEFEGSLIIIGPGSSATVNVWIKQRYDFSSIILAQLISQAFSAALRRCGVFDLHSAGVVAPGHDKAALIAGASGSGKSTLTFQLAANGWGYLSDEVLLLSETESGVEAHGLRPFFALTRNTVSALKLPVVANERPGKSRINPLEFFPEGRVQRSMSGTIFFPVITHEAGSRVTKLTSFQTMERLLKLSPWACYDKPTARAHLNILGYLSRRAVAFDVFAGKDLLEDTWATSRLLDSHARSQPILSKPVG